jgi:choline-sulfatase
MGDDVRPNLLYIHSDQHSPLVLGCYGDPVVRTPNLDRLAREGVLFESAYCPSPICVPSRMSALTGRHPHQNQVWTNEHILDSGIPTLAHALGAAGYRPVIAGRMHALGPDQLHGYVERLVGDHGSNYIGGVPVDRGTLSGTAGPDHISLERSGIGQSAYQVHDEYVAAAAVDYLNRYAVARRAGHEQGPFCLTVGLMLPHPPYVARRQDYEVYQGRVGLPNHPEPPAEEHPFLAWWRRETRAEFTTEQEAIRARTAYWALVARVDALVGQILAALERHHQADNTLIVYTSDHGDMLGEHGLWWKHTFYEASARVPLIMSWPGRLPRGACCERVVSAVDLNATLLDACGAPALPNAAGRSFLAQATGADAPGAWEDVAFCDYCSDEYAPPGGCYQRMIRAGRWKLAYYHGQEPQLFDLQEDPDERHDRAQDPACRGVREALTERVLDGWDPEWVRDAMAAKRADNEVLRAWAREVQPPDSYRWPLKPKMNRLERDG